MIKKYKFPIKTFSICLIFLTTIIQSLSWAFWQSGLGIITSTYLSWGLLLAILFIIIRYWYHTPNNIPQNERKLYGIWLTISIIGIIRGILIIDNYWTAKALIQSIFDLSLPLLALIFSSKIICQSFIRRWLIISTPLFLISLIIGGAQGASHFSYSIYLFLAFFISILPKKWALLIGFIVLYMLSFYITDRAQGLKAAVSISIAILWKYRNYIHNTILRIINWSIWIATITLIILFTTGTYNIFSATSDKDKGKHITKIQKLDGSMSIEDISADTRTVIYESVIKSAIEHNYIWWGRTPARGNDSPYLRNAITGKYERLKNEVCFPNIFTWLGMIGMITYIIFYFQAFRLALNHSQSKTIKILACFISFHFFMGWIEDNNRWDNNNILIWMTIGICFSNEFRRMTDRSLKEWIIECLPKKIFKFKL